MAMDENNDKTIRAYEQGLREYNAAAVPQVIGSLKDWVDASLAVLPQGARVLEIGSAHGRDADYIEARGFVVDRTDAASSFVKYMQSKGHQARTLNALTDDFGGPYAMVYANAVLLHFTGEQVAHVLQKVRNALSDNGLFAFSVKIGEGDAWSDAKLNSPRYFTYWQEAPLRKLLADARFETVFWEEGQTGHDNGTWYHITAKRLDVSE